MAATGPEQWIVDGVPAPVAATYYLAFGDGQLQYTIEVPVMDVPGTETAALPVAWPYIRHAFVQNLYQRASIKKAGQDALLPTRIGVALIRQDGFKTNGMRVALSLDEIRQRIAARASQGGAR